MKNKTNAADVLTSNFKLKVFTYILTKHWSQLLFNSVAGHLTNTFMLLNLQEALHNEEFLFCQQLTKLCHTICYSDMTVLMEMFIKSDCMNGVNPSV